jgi:hypothetical protein
VASPHPPSSSVTAWLIWSSASNPSPPSSKDAARELFTDWEALPAGQRNLVRWMFTTDRAREVYLDWEGEARAMLGRFRLAAARHPHDPDFAALHVADHPDQTLVTY